MKNNAAKAFRLLHRNQIAVILGFRFLYGIRNVTPFIVGSSGFNPIRFFFLNCLGALVWAITFASLGYNLGNVAENILDDVEEYEKTILAIICVTALIWFLWLNRKGKGGASR